LHGTERNARDDFFHRSFREARPGRRPSQDEGPGTISRGLAKRVAGSGVTVNAVLPGPTLSEGVEAMLKEDVEEAGLSIEEAGTAFVRMNRPSSIIQRMATVDEVASMVVHVVSPQASATTGAALRVDGGVVDTIA
jgi:NAD(P)-dependent dehydrogenase (short-subunit alcohol dehydrogenase family)